MKKSVNEGVMSDLNIIAKESRDYETFIKSVEEMLGQKVNELPVEDQEWIRSQYSVAKMRSPKDQSIRETKYNNKTKMKKSELKKLIKEAYLESLRENNESNYFVYDRSGKKLATDLTPEEAKQFVDDNQHKYEFPLAWTEDTRGTFNINKDDEIFPISEQEDDADIEDEMEDDFEAEPAVAQDGESKNQESAPRKRINFENRELEMLVDVNKNATKKGIKIQFLSDDELSKEERTKLVSSLQTYLDEGLAKFVKGAKLNVDSDQDVPNKTKTVGFTIKIGDVFGLVSKVFANRGDDEEDGEEVEAEETETEETEELQELRRQIRGFLKEEQFVGNDGELFEIYPEDFSSALEDALTALGLEEISEETKDKVISIVKKSESVPLSTSKRFLSLTPDQQFDILQTAEMYI